VSKAKGHNSILFLTTLGVYLGLVLVGGAAPHVYAHAATTRHFEISDEIEVTDDLDKDPDGDKSSLSDSIGVYLQDVEFFLRGLTRLNQAGKFDPRSDTFEVGQTTLLPCVPANKTGSYTADQFVTANESLRPSLEWFSKRLTDGYSLADCLPSPHFNGGKAAASRFVFKLDKDAFTVEVRVKKASRDEAGRLFVEIKQSYSLFDPTEKNPVRREVFNHTSFRAENDQTFVVTRLPRADLDSLLASSAK
jgi:hypothetical protein